MALYYDLPVFKDVYKLTLLIYSLTKDFPKEYKYTLGQDLKKDVMVLTVSAMNSWGFYTLTIQLNTDVCFMFIFSFYHFCPNCL